MDIRQQLLAAFEAEHREHLDAIRAALGAGREGRPTDWNDVFRRAHSLKGAARAVDLPPVEAVAHRLETLFEQVSTGTRPLDRESLSATHLALDRIEAFVAEMKAGTPAMPDDTIAALDACLSGKAQAAPPVVEPPPPAAPDTSLVPAAHPPAPAEPVTEAGHAVLRVPAAVVEALTRATHGLAGVMPGEASVTEGLGRIVATAGALRRRAEAIRAGSRDLDRQALRAELGELEAGLTALTRSADDLARAQKASAAALENASGRVREEAERLALVPAETVFGGFARSLRETARAEGREIDVTVRGLDLPVDRAMLQVLKDPVLHALRNALSHGGEPPEARLRTGKPAALAILFEVEARGGRLVIGIHDDGRGPDLPAIAARARERRLLAPDEPADAERLLALVFEPGLSTAASVDALAGRGIGLSVVAEAARRLHGSVRLEPRKPHGTSLVMSLPLSAAQRSVLIVEAGGTRFALPSAAAERLLRLDRAALGSAAGRPVVRIGEGEAAATLPVASLTALLGLAPPAEAEAAIPAVVLRSGGRRCVLAAERLHDVRTLLVLPAPPIGADPALVSGTVILDEDLPALVLDPEGLIARAGEGAAHAASHGIKPDVKSAGTLPAQRRSTILVVDDSITTRTLEKSILEAAGYRVVVCVDGQDALDRLRSGIEPVDLVVADVEMPRLDGFGLVKALRNEAAFTELPVILMTSRGAADDVARGLELGADAYLTKQKFDQRELLDTVGQLL